MQTARCDQSHNILIINDERVLIMLTYMLKYLFVYGLTTIYLQLRAKVKTKIKKTEDLFSVCICMF